MPLASPVNTDADSETELFEDIETTPGKIVLKTV